MLQQLAMKYGINVRSQHSCRTLTDEQPCGEGGEYESFTLDCPLFKERIVMYVHVHTTQRWREL